MARTITIEKLATLLKTEISLGNGKKKILISNDDEGNGYHELFFGVTSGSNMKKMAEYLATAPYMLPFGVNADNIDEYVILG
jgi:hypothetical protein